MTGAHEPTIGRRRGTRWETQPSGYSCPSPRRAPGVRLPCQPEQSSSSSPIPASSGARHAAPHPGRPQVPPHLPPSPLAFLGPRPTASTNDAKAATSSVCDASGVGSETSRSPCPNHEPLPRHGSEGRSASSSSAPGSTVWPANRWRFCTTVVFPTAHPTSTTLLSPLNGSGSSTRNATRAGRKGEWRADSRAPATSGCSSPDVTAANLSRVCSPKSIEFDRQPATCRSQAPCASSMLTGPYSKPCSSSGGSTSRLPAASRNSSTRTAPAESIQHELSPASPSVSRRHDLVTVP